MAAKPKRLIHSADKAEKAAVATLIVYPELAWPAFEKLGVNRRWFLDMRLGDIFDICRELKREGRAIDKITIITRAELRGTSKIDWDFVETLPPEAETHLQVESYLLEVQSAFQKRGAVEAMRVLQRSLDDPSTESSSALAGVESIVRYYSGNASSSLPEIIDATALPKATTERPGEVVYGLLHKGSKLVLGGGSKSFKTFTLADLAISVAHGEPWLGFKTAKGKVLYLNLEIQPWAFSDRLQSIARSKYIDLEPGALETWNLRGFAASYSVLLPKIKERVLSSGYSLIILDPVYKILGDLDENSAGDMGKLLNAIENLAVSTGAAVAFGAHFSKGNQSGKEAIDRISGSGVFARDPDSILVLTRHETENAFVCDSILRNFKPIEPFVVRWDFPLFRRDGALDPARIKKPIGRKREYTPEHILQHLPAEGLTSGEWEAIATKRGLSRRTFYNLLRECEEAKTITLNPEHKWKVQEVQKVQNAPSCTPSARSAAAL